MMQICYKLFFTFFYIRPMEILGIFAAVKV